MNNEFESRRRKSYTRLRMIYDLSMAGLILAVGVVLLFGSRFGLLLFEDIDPYIRYGFGGLCLLYGSFRIYRGIKHDY